MRRNGFSIAALLEIIEDECRDVLIKLDEPGRRRAAEAKWGSKPKPSKLLVIFLIQVVIVGWRWPERHQGRSAVRGHRRGTSRGEFCIDKGQELSALEVVEVGDAIESKPLGRGEDRQPFGAACARLSVVSQSVSSGAWRVRTFPITRTLPTFGLTSLKRPDILCNCSHVMY